MLDLNIALVLIGGLTLLLSLLAGLMKSKVYLLSEPMLATLLGVVIGPLVWGVLRLENWGDPQAILEQVARLTDAFAGMGAALRLPRKYFQRHARSMAAILGPGMLVMWLVSGLVIYVVLGGSFWVALLIGAVVAPVDPVVSGVIVTGEISKQNIPGRIRRSLSAESGANDAVAYPLVFLAILMIEHPPNEALTTWITHTLLWDVLGAVLMGGLIGYGAGRIQEWSQSKFYTEKTSLLVVAAALTVTVLGVVNLMGSNGIVAAFVAGLAFNRVIQGGEETEMADVQESMKRLFIFPLFVFFGMALPWGAWMALGWAAPALAFLILLLRRLPALFALRPFLSPLRQQGDTFFYGWFGPIGVASVYYALLAARETGEQMVWVVGSLVVFASILAHGATSTPFTKWYGRAAGAAEQEAA